MSRFSRRQAREEKRSSPCAHQGSTCNTIAGEGHVKEVLNSHCVLRLDGPRRGGTSCRGDRGEGSPCPLADCGQLPARPCAAGQDTPDRGAGAGEEARPRGTLPVHRDTVVCTYCSPLQARCRPPHPPGLKAFGCCSRVFFPTWITSCRPPAVESFCTAAEDTGSSLTERRARRGAAGFVHPEPLTPSEQLIIRLLAER